VASAVAAHDGRVLRAWTGTDRHLNTMSSRDGQTFGDKATLPFTSRTLRSEEGPWHPSPALAGRDDGFHMAWANMLRREDGAWGPPRRLDGLSPQALCTHGESVVVAWTTRLGRLCAGLAV